MLVCVFYACVLCACVQVEAGKMQLEVLEFDIVGELESLVDMFSVQGLTNGTEIALDLADDIERTVKGDPSRVRQVSLGQATWNAECQTPSGSCSLGRGCGLHTMEQAVKGGPVTSDMVEG